VADGATGTSGSYFDTVAGVVPVGVFGHVAVTIQGTTATVYVNGVQVAGQYFSGQGFQSSQSSLTANRSSDHGALTIGNGNTIPFTGLIDELSIYNRALTAAEIQAIYNAGSAGKCNSTQLRIIPTTGGNAGSVTAQIFGSGFQSGATVKLTGLGPDIIGSNVTQNSSTLTATFSLSGAAIGVRNIIVTNPDSTIATLPNGFTVEQGGAPQLWANVVGRNVIRIGDVETLYVIYGNLGNTDALGTRVVAYFPSAVAPNLTLGNANGVVSVVTQGKTTIVTVNIGRVPAGSTSLIPITLTASASQAPFQVQIKISGH